MDLSPSERNVARHFGISKSYYSLESIDELLSVSLMDGYLDLSGIEVGETIPEDGEMLVPLVLSSEIRNRKLNRILYGVNRKHVEIKWNLKVEACRSFVFTKAASYRDRLAPISGIELKSDLLEMSFHVPGFVLRFGIEDIRITLSTNGELFSESTVN